MHHVTFRKRRATGGQVIDLLIDDHHLRDLVRYVELPSATTDGQADIAGKYESLPGEVLTTGLFEGQAAGIWAVLEAHQSRGRVPLLVCECGEAGCWPLMATVDVTGDTVIWRDFRQPHRKGWSYGGLGPFTFERSQYFAALEWARSSTA